jgi:hypothetical protein
MTNCLSINNFRLRKNYTIISIGALFMIEKVRDKLYLDLFEIKLKNFRSYNELCDAEAFFIRINQPSLNEQIKQKRFTLF